MMLCCFPFFNFIPGLPGNTGPAAADGGGTIASENTQEQRKYDNVS